jgi:ABC-2 type transport system permease protein
MIVYMLMALFGGTWFPVSESLKKFAQFNPVYLYNRLATFIQPGHALDTTAIGGLAGFLAVFVAAAAFLYRKDTRQA